MNTTQAAAVDPQTGERTETAAAAHGIFWRDTYHPPHPLQSTARTGGFHSGCAKMGIYRTRRSAVFRYAPSQGLKTQSHLGNKRGECVSTRRAQSRTLNADQTNARCW